MVAFAIVLVVCAASAVIAAVVAEPPLSPSLLHELEVRATSRETRDSG